MASRRGSSQGYSNRMTRITAVSLIAWSIELRIVTAARLPICSVANFARLDQRGPHQPISEGPRGTACGSRARRYTRGVNQPREAISRGAADATFVIPTKSFSALHEESLKRSRSLMARHLTANSHVQRHPGL